MLNKENKKLILKIQEINYMNIFLKIIDTFL